MRRLGPFLLVTWLASPGAADARPALSVDAPAALRCPAAESALAALVRQLAPRVVVPAEQPLGRFHLRLRPHGARGVSMTLRTDATLLVDRTIDVAAHECEGLADTVALIAAAWVRDADPQPAPAPDALPDGALVQPWDDPEPAAEARAPAASTRTHERSKGPDETPTARKPRRSVDTPESAPEPAAEAPKPAAKAARKSTATVKRMRPPKRREKASEPADAEPAPHGGGTPFGLNLEGALGTTVSLDGLAAPTITGRAGIEATRKRLRLGLRGHAESARTLDSESLVSVRHAQLELDGGAAFAENSTLHGAVLAGAGVDLIAAEARQHERGGVQRSFTPIATAALRAGVRVHRDLDVFASAELVVALRRERFTADDQPLAQTARMRTRLLLGVSWHVF